eukprot:CAMPEP_0174860728 /NCGR_PEP_ID=MMETSP1114-20130205/49898_1 /TAXON_ID=312471 /ORGANISM="Neobodo designis, Strain CCAP 1951/1" /LENGTH=162 /DNA_ID=CAMNT_0016095713 /DNA_START=216 /DNA_END=702 /DNA_ORIENTATION=-
MTCGKATFSRSVVGDASPGVTTRHDTTFDPEAELLVARVEVQGRLVVLVVAAWAAHRLRREALAERRRGRVRERDVREQHRALVEDVATREEEEGAGHADAHGGEPPGHLAVDEVGAGVDEVLELLVEVHVGPLRLGLLRHAHSEHGWRTSLFLPSNKVQKL